LRRDSIVPATAVPLTTVVLVSVPPFASARDPQVRKFSLRLSPSNFEYSPVSVASNESLGLNWNAMLPPVRSRTCWNSAEPISEGASSSAAPGSASKYPSTSTPSRRTERFWYTAAASTPNVESEFFQLTSADACGSVSSARSE
jgi:hypothetical protein